MSAQNYWETLGRTLAELFDSLPAAVILRTFVQYLIALDVSPKQQRILTMSEMRNGI